MKKMSSIFGLILLATTVAYAQDAPKKAVSAPKIPVLTDSQKLVYFKATSEYQSAATQAQQANQVAQQKQAVVQEAVKTVTAACGKDFAPSLDAAGDLVCVEKPKPEEKKK